MSDAPADRDEPMPARRAVYLRWAGLVLILLGESAWLRLGFDVGTINAVGGWWRGLMSGPSATTQIVIAAVVAALVIAGPRLGDIFRRFAEEAIVHRRWPVWLAAQLCAFASLIAIASNASAATLESFQPLGPLHTVGTIAASAALACWIAAITPIRSWLRLIREERAALLSGIIVGAAAWQVGQWTKRSWNPLSKWTLLLVDALLRLARQDVVLETDRQIIRTPGFVVEIGPMCSGYEGIGLICVFLAAFYWFFRRRLRFPQALILLPVGIVAIWLMNSVRIAALVMVGAHISDGVAMRGFHSQAGWLFFNLVALSLMAVALRSPFFRKEKETDAAVGWPASPVADYLIPMLSLVAMNMVAAAFSEDFDWLYPLKFLVTGAMLLWFRTARRAIDWKWSWHGVVNGAVVFALWIAIAEKIDPEATAVHEGLSQLSQGWATLWIVFRVLGSTVTVPLAEELAFRGYLQRRFVSADFESVAFDKTPWWAICLSSLAFGLLHGRWLAGTLAGISYALAARVRGRLGDAVLAHATTNALIAADVLLAGAWWLW